MTQISLVAPTIAVVYTATVELTDAQIKALPTTPAVLVPATEILDYTDPVTSLPIPFDVICSLTPSTGYIADAAAKLVLAYGSDWSVGIAAVSSVADGRTTAAWFGNGSLVRPFPFAPMADVLVVANGLQDNAIVLTVDNNGAGDFTLGSGGILRVTMSYRIINV